MTEQEKSKCCRADVVGTVKYFRNELRSFHERMGNRDDWNPPEKMARAMSGLLYLYLKTDELAESDRILMLATSEDYDRRLAYVLMGY